MVWMEYQCDPIYLFFLHLTAMVFQKLNDYGLSINHINTSKVRYLLLKSVQDKVEDNEFIFRDIATRITTPPFTSYDPLTLELLFHDYRDFASSITDEVVKSYLDRIKQ